MLRTPAEQIFSAAEYDEEAVALLSRALERSSRAHLGQFRRNGDPYITHPLAVAAILAELGADAALIAAALLHDVPSDTGITIGEIRAEFGDGIASLIDELKYLDRRTSFESLDRHDPRVLLLKIADRLHNMQTIQALRPASQRIKAVQTMGLVAPLAREMGYISVADELDTLAVGILGRVSAVVADKSAPIRSRTGIGSARGVLWMATGLLLPASCRQRWLSEWTAELHDHTRASDRAAFTARLLIGLPRMAIQARKYPRSEA